MPVCITGMHRSGTSMVAKVLHESGICLGHATELMPADAHNADGYWEHVKFVQLNEEILNELGAAWDSPPPPDADWKRLCGSPGIRDRVTALLDEFSASEPWGWKDPRTSLTLPFWLALCPDLQVVVCIRNPLEVAVSLRQRGLSSYAFGLRLWSIYNWRLAERMDPDRRLVVHYASVLSTPHRQLRRMLGFLQMEADAGVVERAVVSARQELRHNRFTARQLLDAEVAPELLQLYLELCELAGWSEDMGVFEEAGVRREHSLSASSELISGTAHAGGPGLDDARRLDGQVNAAVVDAAVVDAENTVREREALRSSIAAKESALREPEAPYDPGRANRDAPDALEAQLGALRAELDGRRRADIDLHGALARLAESM